MRDAEVVPISATAPSRTLALAAATAAAFVGLLFAAVSAYWGLGGTWLLDTVGGDLAAQGRAGALTTQLVVWAAAALKIVAALLPVVALRTRGRLCAGLRERRAARALAWTAAVILTGYGFVLTAAGLLVQSGAITVSASADRHALAWHTYLWDPWFLIWGLLIIVALCADRRRNPVLRRSPANAH